MSVPFRLGDAVAWTGGQLRRGVAESQAIGVSIDTRTLAAGELFVAIAGPHHDAHDYLERAAGAGACGLMVDAARALPAGLPAALPVLAVPDTTRALGDLAAGHRAGLAGPVVAITGSNGKTTAKEMCAAILEAGAPTLRTRGNLNNQYGLPLTLLAREPEHRRAVVELGTNHRGEIADLARIARPDVAAVTNVGTAHIEHLGSREAIAAEKGDLLAALPEHGTAVIHGDADTAATLAARTRAQVVRFGRGDDCPVRAQAVQALPGGGYAFRLHSPQGEADVKVAGLGEPTVLNALCAAAAALAVGASLSEVTAGLAAYRPVRGRLERRDLPGGMVLIDDSYNANPQSLEVALRMLASCAGGRRVAVLGEMGELGATAEEAHREAGRLVAELGIEHLLAVGRHAETVAAGARAAGMAPERIDTVPDSAAAAEPLRALARRGDWILLKGSRSARMERVAEALSAEGGC